MRDGRSNRRVRDLERSLKTLFWLFVDLILVAFFAFFVGIGIPYVLKSVYGSTDPLEITLQIVMWLVPTLVLLTGVLFVFLLFRRILR